MWKQLYDWLIDADVITSANATLLTMEFCNGSECLFKSADQRENLRGFTVTKNGICVLDEASFIPDEIFETIYPITNANKAPLFVISTPQFRTGEFYKLYERGMNGVPGITSFDWSTGYDMSEMISPEKLAYYRDTMTEMKFRSEILGEFLDDQSYVFGNFFKCGPGNDGR